MSNHRYINKLPDSVFLHSNSTVIGDVTMGDDCSVWPSAVLRADLGKIVLGRSVNIQDGSVLHTDSGGTVSVGDYALIGHKAMLHGCKVGRAALVGIGAIVLDGAEIGDGAMVTAGCMIRGGAKIPPFALVVTKGAEIKIYENKARPVSTVAGSLEYMQLAKRYQLSQFGPLSNDEIKQLEAEAKQVLKDMFGRDF